MIRGWGITHPAVWQALLITLGWGTFFFLLSVLAIQPPFAWQKFTAKIGNLCCACCKKKPTVDAVPATIN